MIHTYKQALLSWTEEGDTSARLCWFVSCYAAGGQSNVVQWDLAWNFLQARFVAHGHSDGNGCSLDYPFGYCSSGEDELRQAFVQEELVWATEHSRYAQALQDWEAFPDPRWGLCSALLKERKTRTTGIAYLPPEDYRVIRRILEERLASQGLDPTYPFNEDHFDYFKESTNNLCAKNLKRSAWVRHELATLGL